MNEKQIEEQERLAKLKRACSMRSQTELIETIQVPTDLIPALMTNRPELIKVAPKRPYAADEVGHLFDIIRVLMETNDALRMHAQEVARQTDNLENAIRGMQSAARKIGALASFMPDDVEEGE